MMIQQSKLNILILCHKTPYPANDGGTIATLNMITGLSESGHHVEVLMMQTPKHHGDYTKYPKDLLTNIEWNQVFVDTKISALAAIKNLLFSSLPYNAERFIHHGFAQKLVEILSQKSFDFIQLEGLYLTPYIELIRKNSEAKISLRAHNVEHEIWDRMVAGSKNPVKRLYMALIAKRVKKMEVDSIDRVDALISITQRDGSRLIELGGQKPTITIPSGVTVNVQNKETAKIKHTFFHLGALDWLPNQEGLLWFFEKVWYKYHDSFQNWPFALAGRNAPKSFIDKISAFEVDFKGEVPSSIDFMNENGILIVPLLSGSGMRIKIVEAMALGKCIITTSIGAEGIPVESGQHLLIANSPEEFVHAMQWAVCHTDEIIQIGKNAQKLVNQELDNKVLMDKLVQFYQSLLSN